MTVLRVHNPERRSVLREAYYSLRWMLSSACLLAAVWSEAPWWTIVPLGVASVVWFFRAQDEGAKP